MADGGITLTAEEMRAFSISKHRILRRREERALRVPRVLNILCSVQEAEEIVQQFPEVRIVATSRNLTKKQIAMLDTGTVHGPRKRGFQQGRD